MLSINLGSNNLEQKEHKWHFFYKATKSIIAITIPTNVLFTSKVNDIRQLIMKFFDIIKFKKFLFKSKDIVNHFFTFTFVKSVSSQMSCQTNAKN